MITASRTNFVNMQLNINWH